MNELNFHDFYIYDNKNGHLIHKQTVSKGKKGNVAGWKHQRGYVMVTCKKKKYLAHRVIWKMHYGEWPKHQINHINGIKNDNRIENLEDITNQENRDHAVKIGLQAKGQRSNSKIKEEDILKIMQLRKSGKMIKDIAEIYGVHRATIYLILKGVIWKHVTKSLNLLS